MLEIAHPSWHALINHALALMDPSYLSALEKNQHWLPAKERVFAAFSLPKSDVRYVLLGESPYPRKESANGYAFWDQAVNDLWSSNGLSKEVNRATSLRNFIKMLLHADNLLGKPYSQQDISALDKAKLIPQMSSLYEKLLSAGFLLLNASLIWSPDEKMRYHAKHWFVFNQYILQDLVLNQTIQFLLFGKIAQEFKFLPVDKCVIAEHPYVLSFIENNDVLNFFKPFSFLRA
jgi:uracil-DNA glycosylase